MKRFFLAALLFLAQPAQAQLLVTGVGVGSVSGGGGGGYSGPGDLKTYDIWVGTYAYSAAKRGSAAVNVCSASDAACADLSTDATTGLLNVAGTTVGASACNDSTNICTIKTWYNQGAGSSSYNFTQNTIASRATLLVSCGGLTGSACGSATAATYSSASNYSRVQPVTITAVGRRNASTATATDILGARDAGTSGRVEFGAGFFSANNDALCSAGSTINPSATDATWHGYACALNNASSNFTIDASNTAGTVGVNTFDSSAPVIFDSFDGGRPWQGRIASVGVAPSGFNTTELAAANAASKTILGY